MGQAKFCQFAAIHDHVYGTDRGVSKLTTFFLTKRLKPTHNCAIPTAKELRKVYWRTKKFHPRIYSFKPHASLQTFI